MCNVGHSYVGDRGVEGGGGDTNWTSTKPFEGAGRFIAMLP